MTFFAFAKGRKDRPPPDPGKYDIPTTIGSGPKFTLHQKHKVWERDYAPSYNQLPSTLAQRSISIGNKYVELRDPRSDVPGPNLCTSSLGGRRVAIHLRYREQCDQTPGPGSYEIGTTLRGTGISVGGGRRSNFLQNAMEVPPGTYDQPRPMSERRPLTISGKTKESFRKKPHPGPIYNVQKEAGSDARKCAFPKGPRDVPIERTPGPGDYTPLSSFGNRSQIPPRLGSRPPLRDPERNQMPYYDIGTTVKSLRRSMGHRPATSFEVDTPGPGYDLPSTLERRKRSIGIRISQKDPNYDNPAPDSYWMAVDPPRPPPFVGFLGPEPIGRAPADIRAEAKKPGPGSYEAKPLPLPGERGLLFSYRPETSLNERIDTAASYHGCKSTLVGPMFTIGLRDV
jgi:hypothetical protein